VSARQSGIETAVKKGRSKSEKEKTNEKRNEHTGRQTETVKLPDGGGSTTCKIYSYAHTMRDKCARL
jgi:hypothetical protein